MTMTDNNKSLIEFYKMAVVELINALSEQAAADMHGELMKMIMAESLMMSALMHRAHGGSTDSFVQMAGDAISLTHHAGAKVQ